MLDWDVYYLPQILVSYKTITNLKFYFRSEIEHTFIQSKYNYRIINDTKTKYSKFLQKKQFDKFDLKCELISLLSTCLKTIYIIYILKPAEVSLTYILWKVFMFFFWKFFFRHWSKIIIGNLHSSARFYFGLPP
jgi:hypothetical protein